jgi:AraC-like DNA-binding protein
MCFVRSALEPVRACGMDADLIIRQAGISPNALNSPKARVTAGQYGELWQLIALLLKDFLRIAPEGILVEYKNPIDLSARVRRFLRKSLGTKPTTFIFLAAALNMTGATIRRRLQEEGTSYQALKDQVRCELAIEYLSDGRRSTTEIGLELGYSEPSAFHRAFRSWAGVTPGEFRGRLADSHYGEAQAKFLAQL